MMTAVIGVSMSCPKMIVYAGQRMQMQERYTTPKEWNYTEITAYQFESTDKFAPDDPFLCLSDFVRPLSSGIKDTVGGFATTIDPAMEEEFSHDDYQSLLIKTLGERLAEAAAEKIHETLRKEVWGYAKDEKLTMKQLLNEDYQGIRPAVGYPSLPDISVSFLLDKLIDMKRIGIHLTENGMMQPHASVCGLMFAHPASRYFSVGKIDEEQLMDYASRRKIDADVLRKYLAANLQP